MRKISDILLRFLLRDIAAIIRALGTLETSLARHVAKQDAAIATVDQTISALESDRANLVANRNLAAGLGKSVASLRG